MQLKLATALCAVLLLACSVCDAADLCSITQASWLEDVLSAVGARQETACAACRKLDAGESAPAGCRTDRQRCAGACRVHRVDACRGTQTRARLLRLVIILDPPVMLPGASMQLLLRSWRARALPKRCSRPSDWGSSCW